MMNSSSPVRHAVVAATLMTISAFSLAAGMDACLVGVTAVPERTRWMAGEPIRVKVTLFNLQSATVVVPMAYPSLGGAGYPGIGFTLSNGMQAPPRDTPFVNVGIETNIALAQGDSWETHVYANRYVAAPPLGRSTLHWSLSAVCLPAQAAAAPMALVRSGSFDVEIGPGNATELQARANAYLASLDSKSSTGRADALEALTNFTDPSVIPSLEQVYLNGYRADALRGLKKFDGDTRAAKVVSTMLDSANGASARTVLRAVSTWRTGLGADVVDRLLVNPDSSVRLALVDYLGVRDGRTFDLKLTQLASDADPAVAAAAKRALAKRN